jgi:hypothetical protein
MIADSLLIRLEKVRPNGANKWQACCPAHDDKTPSLAIKDVGDRVLLHCFGGCSVEDICAAIGIGVHDLFIDGKAPREILLGVVRRDVVDTLLTETLICEIATADRVAGKAIQPSDIAREQLAQQFIRAAQGVAHG